MANSNAFLDTTIIIDHLRKQNKQKSLLYQLIDTHILYTSTIVEFELFAGAGNKRKFQDVQNVLQTCHILPVTSETAQQAAEIYQELKEKNVVIEIRDILIAATAIVENLPIITFNVEHFKRIKNIALSPLLNKNNL